MGKVIGIDLGTTNSVVSVIDGDNATIIINEEGDRTTPSVVAWGEGESDIMVGQLAKRQAVTNPQNTVYSAKRFIGKKLSEVDGIAGKMPYKVSKSANSDVVIEINGQNFTPPEIASHILRKLKKCAEDYLGESVTEAVITVPAYFNDSQRQATKDAGRIAGLDVKRIINEPTAAALSYGVDSNANDEIIAVYDFGGGTFDVSLLEIGEGVVEVISTNGDTNLGGDNVDEVMIDYLVGEFKKDSGVDVSSDPMVMQRIRDAAEKAKIELSNRLEAEINLPFLTADASGPKHFKLRVSRAKFENLIEKIIDDTLEPCKNALKDAGIGVTDITEVILVGGSTRIPLVQKKVESFFGKAPNKGVNPDEVVAMGAAIQGGVLSGDVNDIVLLDVTPLSLGLETMGEIMTILIPRNTTIPTTKEETFSTAAQNQDRVEIHVLQGERTAAADNRTLGKFMLDGILPAPKGIPKIKVKFNIDANGILSVTARDETTGKDTSVTITAGSGLSEEEIERMVDDAKKHEEADREKRQNIENRNAAVSLCAGVTKAVSDAGEKISPELGSRLTELVDELQKAVDNCEDEKVSDLQKQLQDAMAEFSSQVYNTPQADDNISDDDSVIDAEFEEA